MNLVSQMKPPTVPKSESPVVMYLGAIPNVPAASKR